MLYRFRWLLTADTWFCTTEWKAQNRSVNADSLAVDEELALHFEKTPWRKRQINLVKILCLHLIRHFVTPSPSGEGKYIRN